MEGTATLRGSAPQWSLAGDKQLLDILNNIHQSLVTRCQEVNRKLDEMVSALDGASVDLQNVNNKFMSLSNSQFIESRVYDDDVDIAAQETPKETPKPASPASDIAKLKHSVATLVAAHETIEILASDSDDDDDDEARVVFKPRDMYAHRPLPHVIGSHAWRTKWHAGLHPEDSDSDSSTSKQAREDEEYSDSEPEVASAAPAQHHEREESTASSELPSEQDIGTVPASAAAKPSPSDFAAELARRLGGHQGQITIQEPEYAPPNPAPRKVYRAEQPAPGTIFSDEPPPLDDYQSEESDEPEDDIFAELHKNKPYAHSNREQSRLAEGLFARLTEPEKGDVFSDFKDTQVNNITSSTPAAKQKSTLFEDESEPELFAEEQVNRPTPKQEAAKPDVENVKKPIGGISLFGNTQGAESIGAAILRRNRRKSSSDDDTIEEVPKKEGTQTKSQEKDIFDDLFAKSEREQKKNTKKTIEKTPKEVEKPKPKIDLFSDNIFDDIDDIFTTNVTKTVKKDTNIQKSLFDDDGDIFSDVAVTKTSNNAKLDSQNIVDKNKSIFDSDDDLFSENTVHKTVNNKTVKEISSIEETSKATKSNLLENEDDDIFTKSDIKNDNLIVNADINKEITKNEVLKYDTFSTKHNDDNIKKLINNPYKSKEAANKISTSYIYKDASKSIFDDDENDDLFGNIATKSSTSEHNTKTSSQTQSLKNQNNKSSLFDDDSDEDDLFGTKISSTDQNFCNNNENSQNDEIKTDLNKLSSALDGAETDNNIFRVTAKQVNVENEKVIPSDQNKNKSLIKTDTPINNRKKSLCDDKEQSLFENSNEKLVQDKPKPELLKKPTIIPRNNRNGTKKLDNIKNIDRKDDLKEENMTKDTKDGYSYQGDFAENIKKESNDKSTDILNKRLSTSKTSEEKLPFNAEQDKVTLSEEKIESKISVTEKKTTSTIDEGKLEFTEEPKESKPSVIQEQLVNNIEKQSKPDLKHNEMKSAFPETDLEVPPLENVDNNYDDDIFADEPNNSSTSDPVFHTPNVFDDIFSEPPAFEKSKEPKKSKNINALFDDDSDDEASFFKKNEPVLDDKPDLSPDVNREALFGIFHDEPPAIEVDFSQKPTKSIINDDFLRSDSDDDLFSTQKTQDTIKGSSLFGSSPKLSELASNIGNQSTILTQKENSINRLEKSVESDQKPQIDKPKSPLRESQRDATDGESKKVGKLKTMNFNIDVSTLLPGASPKEKASEQLDTKSSEDLHQNEINKKSLEQTDGQMFAKSSEDLHSKEIIEPLMVKSVSFEGDPDSQVLDNKISKERAKIQVKRRPSTRRARKEAVKKSAIDFGDDSTDNSSSFDDPPKIKPNVEQIQNKELEESNDNDLDFEVKLPKTEDGLHQKIEADLDFSLPKEILPSEEINSNIDLEKNCSQIDLVTKVEEKPDDNFSKNIENRQHEDFALHSEPEIKNIEPTIPAQAETKQKLELDPPKTVTSKIVYILNDEDIFSTPAEKAEVKPRTFDIDDDDLFKSVKNTSKTEVVPNISTLGNSYKANTNTGNKFNNKDSEKNKKSLFEDLSDDDDELFNKNNKTTTKPKSILDSDSEEDLFRGSKKEKDTKAKVVHETKVVKKFEVKSSLFGDEDDNDLFGAKVKSNPAKSPPPVRSTREVVTKPAEPVFEDPLSMLGDNDD